MFPLLSIQRSAGFQDRQFRNLFTRYYRLRAHFKETVLKYEVERSRARRREKKVRENLEELQRREALLEGRKADLLAEKVTREDSSNNSIFFSPPKAGNIRKSEAKSIFKDHSGFLDSGNWGFLSLYLLLASCSISCCRCSKRINTIFANLSHIIPMSLFEVYNLVIAKPPAY